MNIQKTNPIGVKIIENKLISKSGKDLLGKINEKAKAKLNNQDATEFTNKHKDGLGLMVRMDVFNNHPTETVLRLTKNVIENCKLINIESIKENINISDFDFNSLVLLLDKDSSGLIKINRAGSDFDFLYLKNLDNMQDVYFDTYSFLTKEFAFDEGGKDSEFVVQILAYLYYGDITHKHISSKSSIKLNSFTKFLNNSNINITYVDSLWKQRISTEGFKVRGHFRLQPIGEGRKKRKLIWIEEFNKEGYNRKATRELQNE